MSVPQDLSADTSLPSTNGSGGRRGHDVDEVVELRVHGVHGTPPSVMLGDPFPTQVAGDRDARFYRRREEQPCTEDGVTVEAFWWSRLTSGSPIQALWLLFLPFALVNLARFMLLTWDDARDANGGGRRLLDRTVGALLRLLGLALTLGLVLTTVSVSAGMVVAQCAVVEACRVQNTWLAPLGSWTVGQLLLLACVPPLLVLLMFQLVGRISRLTTPPSDRPTTWARDRRFGDERFWREAVESLVLRRLHLAAGLAVLGLLYAGFAPAAPGATVWLVAGAVVLVANVGLVAAVGVRWLNGPRACRRVPAVALGLSFVYAAASVTVVVQRWWGTSDGRVLPPSGLDRATDVLAVVPSVLLLALLVVVIAQAAWFRRDERANPRPAAFAPMWWGLGPVVVATLGVGLIGGFGTGVVFALADAIGAVGPDQPTGPAATDGEFLVVVDASYWTAALLAATFVVVVALALLPAAALVLQRRAASVIWTLAAVLATATAASFRWAGPGPGQILAVVTVAALGAGGCAWMRGSRQPAAPAPPRSDYPVADVDHPADDITGNGAAALGQTWRAWLLGRAKYRYAVVAAGFAVLFGVATALSGAEALLRLIGAPAAGTASRLADRVVGEGFPAFGAATMGVLLMALLSLGLTTFRSQSVRTAVGIAWDLISFWPRLVHPLCPPPYGGRAVLEITKRVTDLVAQDPRRVVVLSGHSQGSLICFSAAMLLAARDGRPSRSDHDRPGGEILHVGLLTYGSQLRWAFPRLFPCFAGYHHLRRLYREGLDGRWRNMYRETDPLGGPVLSWGDASAVGYPGRQLDGPNHIETDGQTFEKPTKHMASRSGPDVRLRDPASLVRPADAPRPTIRGHGGYYDDREAFDTVRDEVTAGIRATLPVDVGPQ